MPYFAVVLVVCRCHVSIQFWHLITILLLYLSLSWHIFRLAKQSCMTLFNSPIFKYSSWLSKKTHSEFMWTQKESLCVSQDKLKTFGKLQRSFTSSDIIKFLKSFVRISNWMKVRDLFYYLLCRRLCLANSRKNSVRERPYELQLKFSQPVQYMNH